MADGDTIRFLADIRLGSDAMRTGGDVARALREIADRIEDDGEYTEPLLVDTIRVEGVWDADGRNAGKWAVKALSAQQATRQVGWSQ